MYTYSHMHTRMSVFVYVHPHIHSRNSRVWRSSRKHIIRTHIFFCFYLFSPTELCREFEGGFGNAQSVFAPLYWHNGWRCAPHHVLRRYVCVNVCTCVCVYTCNCVRVCVCRCVCVCNIIWSQVCGLAMCTAPSCYRGVCVCVCVYFCIVVWFVYTMCYCVCHDLIIHVIVCDVHRTTCHGVCVCVRVYTCKWLRV